MSGKSKATSWEARYNKVKALAERGVGGEKLNAQAILEQMNIERQNATDDAKKYTYTCERNGILIFDLRNPKNGQEDIIVPYFEEVGNDKELWKEVCSITNSVIGCYSNYGISPLTIQNSTRRITIACRDISHLEEVQLTVNDIIWHMLMARGIEVPQPYPAEIIPLK